MAINPARSKQKPGKLVTYGRGIARAYDGRGVDSFFEDDDDGDAVVPSYQTWATTPSVSSVKDTFLVDKAEQEHRSRKQPKHRAAARDTFDVPSSDEEVQAPKRRKRSPTKPKMKSTLVDDSPKVSDLAPWEQARIEDLQTIPKARSGAKGAKSDKPANQLKTELAQDAAYAPSIAFTATATTERPATSGLETQPKSAAARLAARKKLQNGNDRLQAQLSTDSSSVATKRAGPNSNDAVNSLRKRGKTIMGGGNREKGALSQTQRVSSVDDKIKSRGNAHDIFDLPGTSNVEMEEAEAPAMYQRPDARVTKGTNLGCKRSTPVKGISAPARLHAMLPIEPEATDSTAQSPSVLASAPSTPTQTQSPGSLDDSNTQDVFRASKTLTPKQARAWSRILPGEQQENTSPSALPIKSLSIDGHQWGRGASTSTARTLPVTRSDITELPRKRRKLVDHLKAAASDSSSEDDIRVDDYDSDVRMATGRPTSTINAEQMPTNSVSTISQASQGHSQSSNTSVGPRVTYASVRSYLPEDSLEEAMGLDISSSMPQARVGSSRVGANGATSQSMASESKDSDDEAGPARLRSIHELRAAGKNRSFMQDTESLMEDVSNHSSSARGARRGALIEIAAKMMDKSFVQRFIAHGFEQRLATEFGAPPDEVGDFLLAVITSLVLFDGPPQHTLTILYEANVLQWLLQRLHDTVEVRKMARDRRHNMSKSLQTDFLTRTDTYRCYSDLWEHTQPSVMTPCIAALKSLELFIRRSRALGDQSELLTAEQLSASFKDIQPGVSGASVTNVSLSISILESLAIATLPLVWPESVSEQLATLLPKLTTTTDMPRHTSFLSLRLTLNLTNDNAHNCSAFARTDTIQYFLDQLREGFARLECNPSSDDPDRALNFDILILSLGITSNLANQNAIARDLVIDGANAPILAALLATFATGHERAAEAESMEETNVNVAFGYLAVLLANLCQAAPTRQFIAARLPGKTLQRLIAAVEEFVAFHEKVDMLQSMQVFDDDDAAAAADQALGAGKDTATATATANANADAAGGAAVWGAYTARFKAVLARLKAVA
nr:hypothetical protein CFP56_60756 [Quercus suber]